MRPHKSTTMPEEFFHFIWEPGRQYFANTVFLRKEADGFWYMSFANCKWEDKHRFNRREGRSRSRRRYFSHKEYRVEYGPDDPTYDNVKTYVGRAISPIRVEIDSQFVTAHSVA